MGVRRRDGRDKRALRYSSRHESAAWKWSGECAGKEETQECLRSIMLDISTEVDMRVLRYIREAGKNWTTCLSEYDND
jgi:hypothetical protein